MMLAVAELAPRVGLRSACQAFALNRGFVYRDRARRSVTASRPERVNDFETPFVMRLASKRV